MRASNPRARRRIAWTGVAGLLVAGLVLLLTAWQPFRMVEARTLDILSMAHPPPMAVLSEKPGAVVVVAIDEPSFAEIGRQWPWPRSVHADLVEALRAAGARVIGLDLVFSEPSRPEEDEALVGAMGPDVVLASDASVIEAPQAQQVVRTEPLPDLVRAGARFGLASVVLDADGVLRRLPPWPDTFAAVTLAAAEPRATPALPAVGYLQMLGPARTYPTVSYYQALQPDSFLPAGFFRDRIVLVGLSLHTAVDVEEGGLDTFATATTARTGQLTAGVEVQATILDNLRHDLFIRPLPFPLQAASIVAAALVTAFFAWRPVDHRTVLACTGLVLLVGLASYLLVTIARVFLPPVAPSLAVALVLTPIAVRDHTRERRLRREITRAFSHYLAPALVQRLARQPDSLKLGGERRTITVLFCDVRNFTPLAEHMKDDPERLTQLVNRILTPLSTAVLGNGGTIDKYIGDCVMAFWNAPLDDPEHAMHAVQAALAMLDGMEQLNAELETEAPPAESPPRLAVGIGVNTGACVVGNMGSDQRFDYSALGDAVNYASRLEGASKLCGVPLLISASTAAAVADRFEPVLVDRIAVKGRSGAAPVYTVLSADRIDRQVLDRHQVLTEDLIAGRRRASDPEIARFAAEHPALGRIYGAYGGRSPAGAVQVAAVGD